MEQIHLRRADNLSAIEEFPRPYGPRRVITAAAISRHWEILIKAESCERLSEAFCISEIQKTQEA